MPWNRKDLQTTLERFGVTVFNPQVMGLFVTLLADNEQITDASFSDKDKCCAMILTDERFLGIQNKSWLFTKWETTNIYWNAFTGVERGEDLYEDCFEVRGAGGKWFRVSPNDYKK